MIQTLKVLFDELLSGKISPSDVDLNTVVHQLQVKLEEEKKKMSTFRVAKLWIQYIELVDILRNFIRAERLGDWLLHLQCLFDMLPSLAASGHNLYVKSLHIYLQDMFELESKHPEVYKHFLNGHHIVRRSDRLWAGISTDLAIEQCLMRAVKTRGGLVRGRGFTETQRLVWVLSTPACAEINNTMQDLTGEAFTTSDQHKESSQSRMKKDVSDVMTILEFLDSRDPFSMDTPPSLRSIATGIAAHTAVNCDNAEAVGKSILESMTGHSVSEYTFRKKNQVVTMDTKAVKIKGDTVQIDPNLLFQRLVTAGTRYGGLEEVFKFELCSYPPALFESQLLMNPANKPILADSLWDETIASAPKPPEDVHFVLDGGALLHRIPWTKGSTWDDILNSYIRHVSLKYGRATVVFDGYSDAPSTKDGTHNRRTSGCGPEVHFEPSMKLQSNKDQFLSNPCNKQRFIHALGERLSETGCDIQNAIGDADVLIAKAGVASAQTRSTVVVADDTDILVLLIYHGATQYPLWFQPPPKRGSKKGNRSWHISVTRSHLGSVTCNFLPFAHALLGCDTTSRIHTFGKGKSVSKLKDRVFCEQAEVFMQPHSRKEDVIEAGSNALILLYKGDVPDEDLDQLRLRKFFEKTSSSTAAVEPSVLPPTAAAAKYHSLRVYQQVQVWLDNEEDVPPEEWGWRLNDGKFVPILTDLPPAPQELLQVIRCTCKTGCSTLRCSCRRHDLKCSAACSDCKGICSNMESVQVCDEDLEEE